MTDEIRTTIRDYIVTTWLSGDGRGFDDDTDLQEAGILDSFSTLAFVAFLDATYRIELTPADINGTTFRTVQTVTQLVMDRLSSYREQRP